MNRRKAFGLHLLLSLVLIASIATAALLTWYPYGLYRISGLDRLFVVMLIIDMTAGPLLTLLIFKPGKPGLRFDLKVIALVQAAFLAYGLHTLWLARPVFLVAADVRFTLVSASDISEEDLAKAARPEWRTLPWNGPHLVGVLPPDDTQRQALLDVLMRTGKDQEMLPDQYRPFEDVASLVIRGAKVFDGSKGTPMGEPGEKGLPVYSRDDGAWLSIDPQTGRPRTVVANPPAASAPE